MCEPQDWLKGLSCHTWKGYFGSSKNIFMLDNRLTLCMLLKCIHLNPDMTQGAAAKSWLWMGCKNMLIIRSWFWEMVTSTDSNLDSFVLLLIPQLKENTAYPVVMLMYWWEWGKSASVLLRRNFILISFQKNIGTQS